MMYTINDIELFVEGSRLLVYQTFGTKDEEVDIETVTMSVEDLPKDQADEINECLGQHESKMIALEFLRKRKDGSYVLKKKDYLKFIESLNTRMVSNILHKLSSKGLLESAFDEKENDFVFWPKDEKNKKPKAQED